MKRRGNNTERGATMVEGAIVVVILITLLMVIVDGAFFMRGQLSARYGATAGARDGAVAGSSDLADYDALQSIGKAASSSSHKSIAKIVIYKATSATSPVPVPCLTSAQSGLCNVYTGTDLDLSETEFSDSSFTKDDSWPATSRKTGRKAGTDFVGVYVQVKVDGITKLLPSKADDQSVTQIEATQY